MATKPATRKHGFVIRTTNLSIVTHPSYTVTKSQQGGTTTLTLKEGTKKIGTLVVVGDLQRGLCIDCSEGTLPIFNAGENTGCSGRIPCGKDVVITYDSFNERLVIRKNK